MLLCQVSSKTRLSGEQAGKPLLHKHVLHPDRSVADAFEMIELFYRYWEIGNVQVSLLRLPM